MVIKMPENAEKIISLLTKAGCRAYAVGGCIRDSIMGITPHDWDICTSAHPQEVLSLLGKKNLIANGERHGTVTVMYGDELYEITTFRCDGDYSDCRHPESVTFVSDLREDLARRDFTINAIAYNHKEGICDYSGGQEDIENRLIRCVGDPSERFSEDALRILRALRFASRLGFTIEKNTSDAALNKAELLRNISAERIRDELIQIIDGKFAEQMLTDYTGILEVFIPEIIPMIGHLQYNPHHIYDVWMHTVKVIVKSPHGTVPRIAALLHDIAKPRCFTRDERGTGHFKGHPELGAEMAQDIMKRLRFDNKTIEETVKLIRYHDRRPPANEKNVRRMLYDLGREGFFMLCDLKEADAKGQNPALLKEKLEYIEKLRTTGSRELSLGSCFDLKGLSVNGNDLISLGIPRGKQLGITLKYLLDCVIEGELPNDRISLLDAAKDHYSAVCRSEKEQDC